MSPKAPTALGLLILTAVVAAAVVLATDGPRRDRHAEQARSFQRLVGGLGFGPALDLSGCAASFDPRLCPDCPRDEGPIPGGRYFCPQHAASIFYYPRLTPAGAEPHVVLP